MMPFTEACCELLGIYLTGRWANRVSKRGRGLTRRRPPLVSLVRRQAGDLVRLEHRVPGGAVGRDRDPERLAVRDHGRAQRRPLVRDARGEQDRPPDAELGRREGACKAPPPLTNPIRPPSGKVNSKKF